jgi:hypothetical protein
MSTDTHNTQRREALHLTPIPLNDNHRRDEKKPTDGLFGLFVSGMAVGFVIGMVTFILIMGPN